ncbi:MAG: methyltransferase domain-containing protein [Elusimicrobia bacterium]|nr:methyltransferase domain-containing protein [Elusimicrobiota bacterium]
MKTTGSRLSDYYKSIGLNPVGHDISREDRLTVHERKRQNLLEHHLRLPRFGWRGARVLEFGPGSGENAVALARLGARFTFVEPLDYLSDRLKTTFAEFGVSDRIEAVHQGVLETFRSKERYDVVFAEGFVHFLEDHAAAVKRLLSFAGDEGFVVLSDIDPAGTFIEFVKKCYLERACAALGLRAPEQRLEMARILFAPEFARINHSRGFDSWAKDMVLNPLYRPRYFLDLPTIIAAAPEDVALYSSWPNYLDADDLIWHKNVRSEKSMRAAALNGYYARLPHFLHSVPHPEAGLPLFTPAQGRRAAAALGACYKRLDRALERGAAPAAVLEALTGLRRSLVPARNAKLALRVVDDAAALFSSTRNAKTSAAFVSAWKGRTFLRRLWGTPGHYVVLHKTRLYSR